MTLRGLILVTMAAAVLGVFVVSAARADTFSAYLDQDRAVILAALPGPGSDETCIVWTGNLDFDGLAWQIKNPAFVSSCQEANTPRHDWVWPLNLNVTVPDDLVLCFRVIGRVDPNGTWLYGPASVDQKCFLGTTVPVLLP